MNVWESSYLLAAPDSDLFVVSDGDDVSSVGGPGYESNDIGVPGQCACDVACRSRPDFECFVVPEGELEAIPPKGDTCPRKDIGEGFAPDLCAIACAP